MPAGDGFLFGSDKFEALYDCHPFRQVAVSPDDNGHLVAGIFNSLADPVTIPAGTRYGDFTLLCSVDKVATSPLSIAVLDKPVQAPAVPEASLPDAPEAFLCGPTTKRNYERRAAHVMSVFNIASNPLLKTPSDQARLVALVLKHWSTFAFDGSFGRTGLVKHDIVTEHTRCLLYTSPSPRDS